MYPPSLGSIYYQDLQNFIKSYSSYFRFKTAGTVGYQR